MNCPVAWPKDRVSNGVFPGIDGFLFLADGGHHVLEYATGQRIVHGSSIENFQKNILSRERLASKVGCKFLHVIVPDKQSVLSKYLPFPVPFRLGESCLEGLSSNSSVLYPRRLLESMSQEPYYRTDTHLTHFATILLATHIAESLTNVELSGECDKLLRSMVSKSQFIGDLGSKIAPPVAEEVAQFVGSWPARWLHNGPFAGNNGIVDLRFCLAPKFKERVILFGDSFGRDLAWFLSFYFSEVFFFRTPFLHEDLVTQIRPSVTITQCAERYLDSCLSDDARPSFFLYPYLSGHSYTPSKEFAEAFSAVLSFPRPPYWQFCNGIQ